MAMTPRERWLALLAGRTPDRTPTDYWATPEFHERFKKDLACPDDESLWQKLDIDRPLVLFPTPRPARHPDDPDADTWGLRFRAMDYGTGVYQEVAHHPLARVESAADVHAFRWPQPEDFDIAPILHAIEANQGYRPVVACCYEPFLLYAQMRGLEQAFMDLVLNPDIADAALGHLFDIHYEVHRQVFTACPGQIDITYVAEDLGSQTGPLISLEAYRRFLLPNQRKMADLARAHGIHGFACAAAAGSGRHSSMPADPSVATKPGGDAGLPAGVRPPSRCGTGLPAAVGVPPVSDHPLGVAPACPPRWASRRCPITLSVWHRRPAGVRPPSRCGTGVPPVSGHPLGVALPSRRCPITLSVWHRPARRGGRPAGVRPPRGDGRYPLTSCRRA